MKKIVALLLCAVLLISTMPVFAAQEDSQKMQEVLLIVKGKIDIPEELSEFSGNVYTRNEKVTYQFEWRTTDYEKYMSVSCDEKGRITNYYNSNYKTSDKRIAEVSKAEIIAFAESFLKKTVPEAFVSETDLLVHDESAYYVSTNLSYTLSFQRQKDGIAVKGNSATINLSEADGKIYVCSMSIGYDYDTEFEAEGEILSDYQEKYKQLFPAEMIYRDEYNPDAKKNESRTIPGLIYRIKDDNIGYMHSSTGEVIDGVSEEFRKGSVMMDSATNESASGAVTLTPQEIAELENIAGLLEVGVIEKQAKQLPYVDFPDDLVIGSNRLYKDNLGEYFYNLSYSNENGSRYFSIRANAKTGKILSLSGNGAIPYKYTQEEIVLTDAQKQEASAKITEFLNAVAKDEFANSEKKSDNAYRYEYNENYVRIVNGVQYISNGIYVSFDTENNIVTSYSLNFTQGDFKDPAKAIGTDAAYNAILEYAPIIPLYVKSDGVYKKVFTLEKRNVAVDALSGEIKNKVSETPSFAYSDISGHWAEEPATKLAEMQLGLPGGKLEPENTITQEEFLRFAASSILGKYYNDYSTDELYEALVRAGYVLEEEKAPESAIKREDAFVFMVRLAGYDQIAKLKDIYKVSYADGAQLTPEKLGYAAILSGLGVICGDGGNLRPQDSLTRAEAIVLVYKYLLSL